MPCYRPLNAWRSSELTSKGKNKIVFKKSGRHSEIPIQLPCSRCIGCKLEKSQQWAIRSVMEAQLHTQNTFITLTYSDEHLPEDGSLIPWHFQDFMKKLRRRYSPRPIRYYMCGEYGERFTRPHYHACLFGIDFSDKEIFSEQEGILIFTSAILEDLWGKGFCTIGDLNFETAAYTARYIAKKVTGENAPDHYTTTCEHTGKLIHLEPEYNRMSLKPGLAADWYEKFPNDVYPSDYLIHQGRKIQVPRYFDKILESKNPFHLEEIKSKRKIRARANSEENTPERLAAREKVTTLKYKQLSRSYENDT